MLRVLFAHNSYQQRGGEDSVVDDEIRLLRENGVSVQTYTRDNHDIPALGKLAMVRDTFWSPRTVREVDAVIRDFGPQILHVHNTFPLISPAIYWSASAHRIPVVQTLHNFRLLCPQAMLLREGRVCEDCIGTFPWRSVVHRCYRNSSVQSGVLAAAVSLHRLLSTFKSRVTRYIALNEFCRHVFIQGGLPEERIRVKPNFVQDAGCQEDAKRSGFLFVGRLSPEKGIRVLADALKESRSACEIIGSGAESAHVAGLPGVMLSGWRDSDYIHNRMCSSCALVLPSLWYENFPRTLVEAFSCGLPVIASRLGAMATLIRDGETGLLFEPGNSADLAARMAWAQAHPEAMQRMGQAARREYKAKYTPQRNLAILLDIYAEAMASTSQ